MNQVLVIVGTGGLTDVAHAAAAFDAPPASIVDEVTAVVRGLRRRGITSIRIAAPFSLSIDGVDVVRSDLAPALFEGIDAFAWIGACAPAGSSGFVGNTLSLHASWHAGGRELGELDLAMSLAAERGVRVLFASGDDVIDAGVVTKHVVSRAEARPRTIAGVVDDLEHMAAEAPPVLPRTAPLPLELRFKRRWQADVAARGGAERVDVDSVRVSAATFAEAFLEARRVIDASEPMLRGAVSGPQATTISEVLAGVLVEPMPSAGRVYADAAERALAAILAKTEGAALWQRSQRALILHALSSHAPGFFREHDLGARLDQVVASLDATPSFEGLEAMDALAQIEALYVRAERGGGATIDHGSFERCIQRTATRQILVAWMLSELGAQLSVPRTLAQVLPELANQSWLSRLHWLAYEIVFETRFLQRDLPPRGWETRLESLAILGRSAIGEQRAAAVAECALALSAGGENRASTMHELLAFLAERQDETGAIVDHRLAAHRAGAAESIARTTGLALLAFARTTEINSRAA